MKRASSTLSLAIAALCFSATSIAAEQGATVDEQIGRLGVTMQVLADDNTSPMTLLSLPTAASDRALSAADQAKAQTNTDHGQAGSAGDANGANEHAEHGVAVSEIAGNLNELKASIEDGRSIAAEVRSTLVEQARENAHNAKQAAQEVATAAREQAITSAAEASANAAAIAEDAANQAAEAAKAAADNAADAAAAAAENATDAATQVADQAADMRQNAGRP